MGPRENYHITSRASGCPFSARDSSAWAHTALSHIAPRLRQHPLISTYADVVHGLTDTVLQTALETGCEHLCPLCPDLLSRQLSPGAAPFTVGSASRSRPMGGMGGTPSRGSCAMSPPPGMPGMAPLPPASSRLCCTCEPHARKKKVSEGSCRAPTHPRSPLVGVATP